MIVRPFPALSFLSGARAPRAVSTTKCAPGIIHLACGTGMRSAGVQRHIADLAAGLSAQGVPTWVACPADSWLQQALSPDTRHVPSQDSASYFPRNLSALAHAVEAGSIRIIHAHNRASLRVALWLRQRYDCTLFVTAHTMNPYPEYSQADYRIAVSLAVAERYGLDFETDTTATVIYGGVDTERFRPQPDRRAAIRAALDVPLGVPLVVSTARLAKRSSVNCFMQAAAQVLRVRPDAKFALIGDGSQTEWAETKVRHRLLGLGAACRLLGERADLPELLSAADVFVLSSREEALGLSLLEAMACRVPVVASRVGGTVEVLEDQVSGLYSQPQPEDVARKILELLEHPEHAATMAGAARARVCERFDLARTLDQHLELYQGLLG